MITTSSTLAEETSAEVERQLGEIERAEIARQSIEGQGIIIVVRLIVSETGKDSGYFTAGADLSRRARRVGWPWP